MSSIKIKSLTIKNYRSFGNIEQQFDFKPENKKLIAIVGYNNVGKTNLMNAILYGIGYNFISENTFEKHDLFNLNYLNNINISSTLEGSNYPSTNWKGVSESKSISGTYAIETFQEDGELKSKIKPSFFGTNKHYQIFYINFHKIKDEIQTQKTSWGNLRSFLAKHIKKLVDEDEQMKSRKSQFKTDVDNATKLVLEGKKNEEGETIEEHKSNLTKFIENIKSNYCTNLRENNCEVEFGLPDYEDIFLQMMFKIGLNGDSQKLIPIDHFGDGYISMFVMAVIQAIAEENTTDQCLFLFEEPESFLHENHQEYFYKMVLCELAEKGHQVIYTTHSDKMVDITEPDSLIRLEFDKTTKQTIKKFPNAENEANPLAKPENQSIFQNYNSYIKNIEPNLNKILFSEKVILVEGPNDLLVYKYLIEKKALQKAENDSEIKNPKKWAETYLNFNNVAIIPHHGKATAYLLADLCEYLGVDYYLINDWDFEETELELEQIKNFTTEEDLKQSNIYTNQTNNNKRGMITTNWKLLNSAKNDQIHFNIKKLESIISYASNDKNPQKIWQAITTKYSIANQIGVDVFPETLDQFLSLNISQTSTIENQTEPKTNETNIEMPF